VISRGDRWKLGPITPYRRQASVEQLLHLGTKFGNGRRRPRLGAHEERLARPSYTADKVSIAIGRGESARARPIALPASRPPQRAAATETIALRLEAAST